MSSRVTQHIEAKSDTTTYSMKLKASDKLFANWKFALATIDFSDLGDSYYLCGIVETALRDYINPIIGKQ